MTHHPLKIAITCYPSVGGSGVLATALGEELALRGHEIHFISYERPFRLSADMPRIHFHPVEINDYNLFKYPDYTLPLSVKMAEVTQQFNLDILHVHYAVPHATAAVLARSMLPPALHPAIVTTLHGTDTTLLARDAGYAPAIRHALTCSDAVTTVSHFLKTETERLLSLQIPIDVIYNFFAPRPLPATRSRQEVRRDLGVGENEPLILHISNLRPIKRIDLLLQTAARLAPRENFKLLILAGESFQPFAQEVSRLNLQNHLIVRERADDIEEYLPAADLGLFTSASESFCLAILELMWFACPSVSTAVGGIPEVISHHDTGLLAPADPDSLATAVRHLLHDKPLRSRLGQAALRRAHSQFSASAIVPQYESLYHRLLNRPPAHGQ